MIQREILIIFILILTISIFLLIRKIRVLIGTPFIDRDSKKIKNYIKSIAHLLVSNKYKFDLLIITRESDTATLYKFNKLKRRYKNIIIKTVPHYEIKDRHNFERLATKRQIILDWAIKNKYDYLFFIDSDIIINKDTFDLLFQAKSDICYCPYIPSWHTKPLIGIMKNNQYHIINAESDSLKDKKYIDIIGGGMGATLIKKTAFNIKFKIIKISAYFEEENIYPIVEGEDIGFFYNCMMKKKNMKAILHHKILHDV